MLNNLVQACTFTSELLLEIAQTLNVELEFMVDKIKVGTYEKFT